MRWAPVLVLVLVLFAISAGCTSVQLGGGSATLPENHTPATCLPGEGCIILRSRREEEMMVDDDLQSDLTPILNGENLTESIFGEYLAWLGEPGNEAQKEEFKNALRPLIGGMGDGHQN